MAQSVDEIARDVCERARAGDQNAMALIAETKESAETGKSARAREMLRAIFRYCETHPVSPRAGGFAPGEDGQFSKKSTHSLGVLKSVAFGQCAFIPDLIADVLFLVAQERNQKARDVAALMLANGTLLKNPCVQAVADVLGNGYGHLFLDGVKGRPMPKSDRKDRRIVVVCGQMVGKARAIQLARMGSYDNLQERAANELAHKNRPEMRA